MTHALNIPPRRQRPPAVNAVTAVAVIVGAAVVFVALRLNKDPKDEQRRDQEASKRAQIEQEIQLSIPGPFVKVSMRPSIEDARRGVTPEVARWRYVSALSELSPDQILFYVDGKDKDVFVIAYQPALLRERICDSETWLRSFVSTLRELKFVSLRCGPGPTVEVR